jgi:hypothetical protein
MRSPKRTVRREVFLLIVTILLRGVEARGCPDNGVARLIRVPREAIAVPNRRLSFVRGAAGTRRSTDSTACVHRSPKSLTVLVYFASSAVKRW